MKWTEANVFSTIIAVMTAYFVTAIIMGVLDPVLRGPLVSLVTYYGNCTNCPDPDILVNFVEYGFIPIMMACGLLMIFMSPLKKESEKYVAKE